MTNVVISGPYGRMGQTLCRLVKEHKDLKLAGGLLPQGVAPEEHGVPAFYDLKDVPQETGTAVLIDFTEPTATLSRLKEAAELGMGVVIGTTGFTSDQLDTIREYSQKIPVLLSANMSLGVNLLLDVVEKLAARLDGYDIEIVETHHRLKKDAPSGTALALANAAAAGRQVNLKDVENHGRSGIVGERTPSEIGIHAVRGGDVVGDHTVLFAGIGERVEVSHKASSRDTFAAGALFAAQFLAQQPSGLYTMKDALKI